MAAEFVHLHLHSDYSLLDGACSIQGIVKMATELKMPAVAITDHGFMGGAIDFYKQLNAAKIKPIIGLEAYLSPTTRFDKDQNRENIRGFHIILLAENLRGYENLCKLMSEAYKDGFYYKPRIDKEILAKYHEGIIASSACLQGEIPIAILKGQKKEAKKILHQYIDIMGRNNFYLEIMDHGMEEQKLVNRGVIELAKEEDIPLIATNDVHFLRKEDAKSHELMLCIQTHSNVNDPKRFKFSSDQFYFKSAEEMAEVFKEVPEALSNTLQVAERCSIELTFVPKVNHYPVYNTSSMGLTQLQYLRQICLDGIKMRYDFDPLAENLTQEQQAVIKRMDYELGVIDKSKYCSYFLVVWDFINYAKQQKIPVGPGRGSGAGSIVAYLTTITDIDPLRYQLLFERFLNPERVSPPDFDIDFCERRRGEVIEYVRQKYGVDSVAQIGTYGTLKPKAVLKDIARVLGHTFEEGDRITKLIDGTDPKMTLKKAIEGSQELRDLIASESWVKEIFDYAKPLENLNRNMTKHAAGVIIGDQPLDNVVPLARDPDNEMITQYSAKYCEELGLLKMDFLGLKTLTVIQDAVDNVKKSRNIEIDLAKLPLDDKKTFDLLNKGDTVSVFQLESDGMQNLCRQFIVERIEHIIALIAIYRPGPMQFIPEFVARKNGSMTTEYDHPLMEPILKETCGIMLYQEQVMQTVQALGGFTLGEADSLRKAIGKKKEKDIALMKDKFIAGSAKTCGLSAQRATEIWDKIGKFAGYGFNKSHSAAYAFLAYRTAYLKANYPVEFMAAVLSSEIDNAEKIAFLISECREMKISILPPDINSSSISFAVDGKSIRFGLGAIKGVGENAAKSIINAREKEGPFKSLMEFCERTGGSLNSRMLEHLIRAGALDSLKLRRSQLLEVIGQFMAAAQNKIKEKASGQGSLFDLLPENEVENSFAIRIPDKPELEEHEILQDEKALLGFYVTGHPLGKYSELISTYSTTTLIKAQQMSNDDGLKVGGIIKTVQKRRSKKDDKPYAILTLEDIDGTMDCMVYNKLFESSVEIENENGDIQKVPLQDILEADKPVFVEALLSQREETEAKKLNAEKIIPLQNVTAHYTKELHLHLFEHGGANPDTLQKVKDLCMSAKVEKNNKNGASLILCIKCSNGDIAYIESEIKVRVTEKMLDQIQELLGQHRYKLKADKSVPQPRQRYSGHKFEKKEETDAS